MKFTHLNESIENFANIKDMTTVIDSVTGDAVDSSKQKEEDINKELDSAMKDAGIPESELKNGFTGNHNKKVSSSDLKQMKLAEAVDDVFDWGSDANFDYEIWFEGNCISSDMGFSSFEDAYEWAEEEVNDFLSDKAYSTDSIGDFDIRVYENGALCEACNKKNKLKESDTNDKLVIYKELGKYKVTPKSNYNINYQNARKVKDASMFDSADEIITYYCSHFGSNKDDFEIIDESCNKHEIKEELSDESFDSFSHEIYNAIAPIFKQYKSSDKDLYNAIDMFLSHIDDDDMYESLNESSEELARHMFASLVKLGKNPWDGYSILNDGYFVERIYAEDDADAIEQFNNWVANKQSTNESLNESREDDLFNSALAELENLVGIDENLSLDEANDRQRSKEKAKKLDQKNNNNNTNNKVVNNDDELKKQQANRQMGREIQSAKQLQTQAVEKEKQQKLDTIKKVSDVATAPIDFVNKLSKIPGGVKNAISKAGIHTSY